jgi:hypothetical protein
VLDTDGRVLVMTGDGSNPTTFEVFNPAVTAPSNPWAGPYSYSTVPACEMVYPHGHLLPKRDSQKRATLFVSSPVYTGIPWVGCGLQIPTQILPLHATLGDYTSHAWQTGPALATDPRRSDNGSVLLVDTTVPAPTATVYIAAGREHPFNTVPASGNPETDTAEYFLNAQISPPAAGVALPSLNIRRWDANFVMVPGRRILALGGDTTDLDIPKSSRPRCWISRTS